MGNPPRFYRVIEYINNSSAGFSVWFHTILYKQPELELEDEFNLKERQGVMLAVFKKVFEKLNA